MHFIQQVYIRYDLDLVDINILKFIKRQYSSKKLAYSSKNDLYKTVAINFLKLLNYRK